jgi:hypothetical protein
MGFSMREIDCAHWSRDNNYLTLIQGRYRCIIVIDVANTKMQISTLNQGQVIIFTVQKCVQSIFRIEK